MSKQTYYTAVGHFKRRINSHGQSYPVIIINQMEYCVDIQEMGLWTCTLYTSGAADELLW